jgi:AraC family transcriptional regulator
MPLSDDTSTIIRAEGNYYGTVRRRFVVDGLHMSETAYIAGTRIPTHRHECPSFFMPLRGAFIEGCGNVVRRYETGDVSYHPPHEPHWLHTQGSATHGFAVEVGAPWRTMFNDTTAWTRAPRDLSRSRISWLMGRLFLELHTHDSARPLIVQSLGVSITTELSHERTRHDRHPPRWLTQIREQLQDQPYLTPALHDLAKTAGITSAGLIKAFRRHEGCTPGEYLRTLRLTQARTELGATDHPLAAIALNAGFYDQSHFTRTFHRAMGVPPQTYRRILRSKTHP